MNEFPSMIFVYVATAVISYLIGSLNMAILISKFHKSKDIRDYGSGNAGMTNMLRTFGKRAATWTFVGDFLKGAIVVFVAREIGKSLQINLDLAYFAAFFVMLGHIYPLYFGFKGGKGILISIGALLFFDPFVGLSLLALFAVLVAITKIVSVGSIAAAASLPLMTFLIHRITNPQFYIRDTVVALIIGVFVVFMHRSNIVRLINGTENKFGKSKEK